MSEEEKKLESAAEEAMKEKPSETPAESSPETPKEASGETAEPAPAAASRPTPAEASEEAAAKSKTEAAQAAAARKQQADPGAQTTSEPSDAPAAELQGPSDAEKEAKAKAAAEARAARASARAKKTDEEGGEPAAPKEPSPKQPLLDRFVQLLKEQAGEESVTEAHINEKDRHLPSVVVKADRWIDCAAALRDHEELRMNYLRNLSGVDCETHFEVVYHLLSLPLKHEICVKVRTDREAPSIPSVTPLWATANWNEREVFDLFGIDFPGHPDLRRIMMADDWVGHPLRKDFVSYDPEV